MSANRIQTVPFQRKNHHLYDNCGHGSSFAEVMEEHWSWHKPPAPFMQPRPLHYIHAEHSVFYADMEAMIIALEKLSENHFTPKAFDLAALTQTPKKKNIPPMSHPWEKSSFDKYMAKQAHRKEVA